MSIELLVGLTLSKVFDNGDQLVFITDTNRRFEMYHDQDCCEYVALEETIGDLNDLIGSPILTAEERFSDDPAPEGYSDEVEKWTFYELRTIKGSVTLRWFGSSNGYYSTSVTFKEIT